MCPFATPFFVPPGFLFGVESPRQFMQDMFGKGWLKLGHDLRLPCYLVGFAGAHFAAEYQDAKADPGAAISI